jgi:hypothetical protein
VVYSSAPWITNTGIASFAAEKLPIELVEIGAEVLAAYTLSVKPVVDIGDRVLGRV